MVFGQLAGADSLREIEGGLSTALDKLKRLRLKQAPTRSILSYANQHRPCQLFETTFYQLSHQVQTPAAGQKPRFRFKNRLVSVDASTIELCLSMYD